MWCPRSSILTDSLHSFINDRTMALASNFSDDAQNRVWVQSESKVDSPKSGSLFSSNLDPVSICHVSSFNGWWFGTCEYMWNIFPKSSDDDPIWRTPSFFRGGRHSTNQFSPVCWVPHGCLASTSRMSRSAFQPPAGRHKGEWGRCQFLCFPRWVLIDVDALIDMFYEIQIF